MKRRSHNYSLDMDSKTEVLFRDAIFLGEGHNGIVYQLPGDKVIKIFYDAKVCKDEGGILKRVNGSKYFPKMYKLGKKYIVREKVVGMQLDKYIRRFGLNQELSLNLYRMLKEFKKLGFTKLDTRCKDVYVNDRGKVMLIDPKKCYKRRVEFPRHLLKGMYKRDAMWKFLDYIGEIDERAKVDWQFQMSIYLKKKELL